MSDSSQHLRIALTITQLFLVALGSINLLIILLILIKPQICVSSICGATCRRSIHRHVQNDALQQIQMSARKKNKNATENSSQSEKNKTFCMVFWPNPYMSQSYIISCSVAVFIIPVLAIFYFYYHVFCKLREAAKGSRRLHRNKTRSSYQRVTRSVQRVVLFHLLCWTPFWLFNLFTSIYRIRISTQFLRICVNIIHLFPYINCAINPLLYAYRAENFRVAFKSLLFLGRRTASLSLPDETRTSTTRSTYYRNSSNVDSMKPNLALAKKQQCVDENASIYIAEDESLAIDNGPCMDIKELERRKAELMNWRPYDGTNADVLMIDQDQHKSSARSLFMPAITVATNGEKGTNL
ncbi:hypothetical protein WR25_26071 [Diploscapter pachys]|uniref:G-protein coupled receptors family 1 profile domain-containing protein n=1 Tax=Diploscapter pachys TaxID=2018661 RepID=A0A2A2K765_9BILA|nr:hypothetical protein WR25_26071 [Diploscapter pachys]